MPHLILFAFALLAIFLIRRDTSQRGDISAATWFPTLWVSVLASRPFSSWFIFEAPNVADYEYSLEGSPIDRNFYLAVILGSLYFLSKRRTNWALLVRENWPIFFFYGYLLITVLWADSSIVSFKRWFKDLGNVFVALVILTEVNPLQAFRAVFVRCAYVLIPLSIILIRYFPDIGRHYSRYSGTMEATGVTFQKNSLGAMVLVCGMIVIWDWFEYLTDKTRRNWIDRWLPLVILFMGGWLLHLCDSKTSMACLGLAAGILVASRIPFIQKHLDSLGGVVLCGSLGMFALDWAFGIKAFILESLGRDATLTGRTDVWRVLLDLKTDPIFGTGFCSFWSDSFYRTKLPIWVSSSAHNGYLEIYIDGGMIGVAFLLLLFAAMGVKFSRRLGRDGNYGLVRFTILMVTVLASFTESHPARMSPLWFLFLLAALDAPQTYASRHSLMEPQLSPEPSLNT